jgi:hypothetical protein
MKVLMISTDWRIAVLGSHEHVRMSAAHKPADTDPAEDIPTIRIPSVPSIAKRVAKRAAKGVSPNTDNEAAFIQ